jgi:hypothetical protein
MLATASSGAELAELDLVRTTFGLSAHEISGAARIGGRLYVVADGPDDLRVYAVRDEGKRFRLEPAIDLARLKGGAEYLAALQEDSSLPAVDRRIDFEGLAGCGGRVYIANERARHVLRVTAGAAVERLPIDLGSLRGLFTGGGNAGFEGVAVDCAAGMMYVANERLPRAILRVRMRDWRVLDASDLQHDAGPRSGAGAADAATVNDDFSDLAFDAGHLYVLERSARRIAKVDPSTLRVIARVSYASAEADLYQTDPRFGLAEALVLDRRQVILGLDNNGAPLSERAQARYGVSGNPSALLYFKRPPGF